MRTQPLLPPASTESQPPRRSTIVTGWFAGSDPTFAASIKGWE